MEFDTWDFIFRKRNTQLLLFSTSKYGDDVTIKIAYFQELKPCTMEQTGYCLVYKFIFFSFFFL